MTSTTASSAAATQVAENIRFYGDPILGQKRCYEDGHPPYPPTDGETCYCYSLLTAPHKERQAAIADSLEKAAALYRADKIPAPKFSSLDSVVCLDSVAAVHNFAAVHGVEVEQTQCKDGVHHTAEIDLGSYSLRVFHIVRRAAEQVPA